MAEIRFSWNSVKAAANKRNHRVSFSEAQTVFYDDEDNQDHLRAESDSHRAIDIRQTEKEMRKEYDFSKARRNPYAKRLKKSITIRLDEGTVDYFRSLAEEAEMPYQSLINLYLRDCAASNRRPSVVWKDSRKGAA